MQITTRTFFISAPYYHLSKLQLEISIALKLWLVRISVGQQATVIGLMKTFAPPKEERIWRASVWIYLARGTSMTCQYANAGIARR